MVRQVAVQVKITDKDKIRAALDNTKNEFETCRQMLAESHGRADGPLLEGDEPRYTNFILASSFYMESPGGHGDVCGAPGDVWRRVSESLEGLRAMA